MMDRLIMAGLFLAALTILTDHFLFALPELAAIILYTAAVCLFVFGMYRQSKNRN